MTTAAPTTVETDIDIDAPITRVFHVFTAEIGTWWDEDKHILTAPLEGMVFEPFVGGNIIDRGTDGSESRWARVLAYEPPHRICFSWDINTHWELEPDPQRASEVEITFTEITPERTHVALTHRNLDRHGQDWESMRDAVAQGWKLSPLADRIESANSVVGHLLPTVTDETMRARLATASTYTAVLLRITDKFVLPAVKPTVWEHGRRNMALVQAGLLSIVLPVADDTELAGLAVFAASLDDTRAIMDDDPGVRSGIFDYELHPARGVPGTALS